MRLFLSNGIIVIIAIASVFSNSLDAIAIKNHERNDLSQVSLGYPVNISIIHQSNPRLPRPKGSR
ncbi:hypothetical protein APA_419 [Pseudanabaena sp. lw0831]|uniref:hypothetical protein n=1 Tax=Pseudanabaena sp. lw0831 TaxID=1357935 RepID=UPI0019159338|nr:hypothetical protein [Pseudanabaena sp. lw0831]GBO52750.1 hypothetical protein APA_419 [Pseudanabaena sp. lw0831]